MAKVKPKSRNTVPTQLNRQHLWILVCMAFVLGITTWFAFEPGLKNGFVDWDDLKYITENGCIQLKGKDLMNRLFFGECKYIMGNYHPITILTYAWNYQSGKFDPLVYHKMNLYLHIFNSLLIIVLGYKISGGRLFIAGAAAILFALHPVHVESVTWAAERKDVLYTAFLLLAWLAWLYLEKSNIGLRTTLVSILFILSCLSKGMAVVFPLLLLLTLWIQEENFRAFFKNPTQNLSYIPVDKAIEFGVYFIIALFFGWMAVHSQDTQGGIRDYPQYGTLHKFIMANYGFVHYLWKMVWPQGLVAIYPYPILDAGVLPLKYNIAPFIVLAIIGMVLFSLRYTRTLMFALAGYLICILPVLQILPVGEAIACDRYFYFSSIPLFLGMVWAIDYLSSGKKIAQISAASVIIIISVLLFLRTREQVLVWYNDLSLFSNVIKYEPTASQAHNNVGIYHQRQQDPATALPYYEEAIRLNPKYARAYSNMGACYYDMKKYKESVEIYRKSILSDPKFADAWYNLGNSWYMLGRYDIAQKYYSHAIKLNEYYYAAYYNRAVCKGVRGKHQEAMEDYLIAARGGHPQAQDALRRSGVSWDNRGPASKLPGMK